MGAASNFKPGMLITTGRLGPATIYAGMVEPTPMSTARALCLMPRKSIGIVLYAIDEQQILVVVDGVVGIVMIAEIQVIP